MMKPRTTPGASVDIISNGFRLMIPAGDERQYRVAQLDDYANLARGHFPAHPPWTLSLLARASASSLPGTWGFGLWNDPFGLSFGFGGNPWRLPALPNAVWFFYASEENYLSLQRPDHTPAKQRQCVPLSRSPLENRATSATHNGFMAQVFHSPLIPSTLLALAGILALPALPILTTRKARISLRTLVGRIVQEDGLRLRVDVTEWHRYRLAWSPKRCAFWVDDALALETSLTPRPPLGLVIWIDNQYAAWRPDGTLQWGLLSNEAAWLEVREIESCG
ncbi:MAG: hypothetical protein Fur0043_12410 [Anaerolineales bacterium]